MTRVTRLIADRVHPQGEAPRRLYIFGAGSLGRLVAGHFITGLAAEGFIDNNRELWGREIAGLRVFSPAVLVGEGNQNIVMLICVLNKNDAQTVCRQFKAMGYYNVVSIADELYSS